MGLGYVTSYYTANGLKANRIPGNVIFNVSRITPRYIHLLILQAPMVTLKINNH